jgi:uncharacterized protein with PQ loop repeat
VSFGYAIGWVGVGFGLLVPIPQLIKILRHQKVDGIALWTYIFLVACLACYLWHAVYIKSAVFTVAQSINLINNGAILVLLVKKKG